MIRLAVVYPNGKVPLYEAAIRRSTRVTVSHTVRATLENANSVEDVDGLSRFVGDFDACIVHGGPDDVPETLRKLVATGKPVLLDSDYIRSANELERIQVVSAQIAVTQSGRHTAYARSILESLRAGRLGKPGLVRIHRWARAKDGDLESQLRRLVIREIDFTCSLFDAAPTDVFGTRLGTSDELMGIHSHLGFDGGMAMIECSLADRMPYYSACLIGSAGAAYADDHHNTNLLYGDTTTGRPVANDGSTWLSQLDAFAELIESGAAENGVAELRKAFEVRDALMNSANTQRVAKCVGGRYELQ